MKLTAEDGRIFDLPDDIYEVLDKFEVSGLPADLEALRGVLPDAELQAIASLRTNGTPQSPGITVLATPGERHAPGPAETGMVDQEKSQYTPEEERHLSQDFKSSVTRTRQAQCNHTQQLLDKGTGTVFCARCQQPIIEGSGFKHTPNPGRPEDAVAPAVAPDAFRARR